MKYTQYRICLLFYWQIGMVVFWTQKVTNNITFCHDLIQYSPKKYHNDLWNDMVEKQSSHTITMQTTSGLALRLEDLVKYLTLTKYTNWILYGNYIISNNIHLSSLSQNPNSYSWIQIS